ncbi:LLM class flavin-dependent oxidoreductase [Phyllobacterium sophorae]|nr:LLM class flavin-dependent oxidoreductase [Phyllobacterium sophorae]
MSIEFMHVPTTGLQLRGEVASVFDGPYETRRLALLERTCFRQLLIDGPAGIFANIGIAAAAARTTSSLGLTLTHRAGIFQPTVAARQLAELDRLSDGRLSIRFPVGFDVAADGKPRSPRNHVEIFQQTDEYLVLLKRLWSNDRPFDHEGPFYSVTAGYVDRKSPRRAGIPIRMGGISGTALKFAGRHADIFELTPGTPEEVVKLMERMQVAAAPYGRAGKIRFALPVRVGPMRQADPSHPEGAKLDTVAKRIHVFGSPAHIGEALRAYTSIGVDEFMVEGLEDHLSIAEFSHQSAQSFKSVSSPVKPVKGTRRPTHASANRNFAVREN